MTAEIVPDPPRLHTAGRPVRGLHHLMPLLIKVINTLE